MNKIRFYLLTAVMALILMAMAAYPEEKTVVVWGIVVGLLTLPWLALLTAAYSLPLPENPPPVVHQPYEPALAAIPADYAGGDPSVEPVDPPLPLGGMRED